MRVNEIRHIQRANLLACLEKVIPPEELLSLNLGITAPAGVTDFRGFYGDSNY